MPIRLRAPAWAWAATVAAIGLFASLGTWQLRRGLDKLDFLARFESADGPVLEVDARTPAPGRLELQRAEARGRYRPGRQLLQDGQSRDGQPGYHVWTPLQLTGGGLLLVNRGWVPQPARLEQVPELPAPDGVRRVHGWWRELPQPAIRVDESVCKPAERFPATVVYPTHAQLECLLGEPVLPGLLLLDPAEEGGFVREWRNPGLPPERHFGYAFTWYALGVTAVVLFLKHGLKR